MDNIDYMDRVLQVTQLTQSVTVCARIHRKCLRQNATNVFSKMPQMSSTRIENGCESSIMMYIFFFKR